MTEQRGPTSTPTLSQYTANSLRAILGAANEAALDTAFNNFISAQAVITVNGKRISREAYRQRLAGEITGDVGTPNFNVEGAVEVSADKQHPETAGTVGLFYEAEVFGKFFVFGARQANTIRSSLNVEIVEEGPPPASQIARTGDQRRVIVLNEVSTDQPNPIHPPTSGQ